MNTQNTYLIFYILPISFSPSNTQFNIPFVVELQTHLVTHNAGWVLSSNPTTSVSHSCFILFLSYVYHSFLVCLCSIQNLRLIGISLPQKHPTKQCLPNRRLNNFLLDSFIPVMIPLIYITLKDLLNFHFYFSLF